MMHARVRARSAAVCGGAVAVKLAKAIPKDSPATRESAARKPSRERAQHEERER